MILSHSLSTADRLKAKEPTKPFNKDATFKGLPDYFDIFIKTEPGQFAALFVPS